MNNSIITLALVSLKTKDPYSAIKAILNHKNCSHLTKVKFALHCAESSFKYIKDEKNKKTVRKTLDLVADWIISPNSVKNEELNAAAYAAAYAANAAASAAAYAANAAHAAANAAASAAAYAANAAHAAAKAAAYAANAAANASYLRYLVKLVTLQKGKEIKLMEALYE